MQGSGQTEGSHRRHQGTRLADLLVAGYHRLYRVIDQAADLPCRISRALGLGTHLAGNHGKASALVAGAPASTAALSASRLVWKTSPSITSMIRAMRREACSRQGGQDNQQQAAGSGSEQPSLQGTRITGQGHAGVNVM